MGTKSKARYSSAVLVRHAKLPVRLRTVRNRAVAGRNIHVKLGSGRAGRGARQYGMAPDKTVRSGFMKSRGTMRVGNMNTD